MLACIQKLTPKNRSETPLLRRLRLLLPAAVFVAMAWAGFSQPAAGLIINTADNIVTVESDADVGLTFDVIYSCSGFVSGDGNQADCEAATSTDLNVPADGVEDLGGTWWTISAFSDTSITFDIKIINSADDAVLSDWGVKIINPDADSATLNDDGTLPWYLEVDAKHPGFMYVDICFASTAPSPSGKEKCGGGSVNDGLPEGMMDMVTLTLLGGWSDGIMLEIFPSKWQSIGTGGLSQEIAGDVSLTGDRVPEPASLLLFGIGLIGLIGLTSVARRRRRFAA